jgi:hypothetical protein
MLVLLAELFEAVGQGGEPRIFGMLPQPQSE